MKNAKNTVYFLGAGATRADFPTAPLGDQLLHAVLSGDGPSADLSNLLAQVYDPSTVAPTTPESRRPRLDDVLTLLESAMCGRAPCPPGLAPDQVRACHRLLLAGIGRTFEARLGTGAGPLASQLAERVLNTNATIVTTNYDIVLDNVLFDRGNVNYGTCVRSSVWRVGGYPQDREDEIRYYNYDTHTSFRIRQGRLPLLKLNGSLNWLYCPRCNELDVSFHEKAGVAILSEPHLGRCSRSSCTGRYQALLVGPSLEQRYEHRILAEVWSCAEKAVAEAERLIVVGYSLPEADYLIRAMLTRCFALRSSSVLVVSSPSPDSRTTDASFMSRYRRLFPDCEFEWGGFKALVDTLPLTRTDL